MSRLLHAQTLIFDQVDFYLGSSRIFVPLSSLQSKLFVNNQLLPWTLEDGSSVLDSSISSTKIYYNEISGNPGFTSLRFFPDRIGFWRLILSWNTSEVIKEYDVSGAKNSTGGLNASFVG